MGVIRRLCHCSLLVVASTTALKPTVEREGRAHNRNPLKISFQEATTMEQFPLNEPCTAYIRDVMSGVGRADMQCSTPSGMMYSIPHIDEAWVEEKQRNHELISGYTEIDLPPNTMVDAATHMLILDSPPILRNPSGDDETIRRRRLTTAEKARGKKTVLVVRVDASDSSTSLSESQLVSDIFGDNGDPNNLRSQYLACSYGKLELNKAANRNGEEMNISNGVVSVSLPSLSKSIGDTAMLNAINRELEDQFSTPAFKLADFVIYCLPPGVMNELDVAYAFMDGYVSVFNDAACNQVSTQLHEFGHNLNLAHSGMGNDEYGDKSGMMGYSYEEDDLPYMCFNSAKSWQLGWYEDKALRLAPSPTGQYEFFPELAGVADYGTTDGSVVVMIEQEFSKWAYFINYNAAKGINKGSQYGKDKILVTMKDTTDEANVSKLVATMKVGQNLKIRNFNGRADEELQVRWSKFANDVASLDIKLKGPTVPAPTLSPTIPPTIDQSSAPSRAPSAGPSSIPTVAYSEQPSQKPTMRPSSIPTLTHSEEPTLSRHPTLSIAPSGAPSGSKTPTSSQNPSGSPSMSLVPSSEPSTSPPSQQQSFAPSDQASQSPTLAPSLSKSPSSSPSITRSAFPSFVPSGFPSYVPSQQPSPAPSMQPSFRSAEFQSTFALQLPRGTDFDIVSSVCEALGTYLDGVTKSTFGNEALTNTSCLPVVEAAISQNVFDRGTDVTVVTTTYFPIAVLGPNATEYESHVRDTISSDETNTRLPGIIRGAIEEVGLEKGSTVRMEWHDETFDTPVLKVVFEEEPASVASASSRKHASIHVGCILSPLYLLFYL